MMFLLGFSTLGLIITAHIFVRQLASYVQKRDDLSERKKRLLMAGGMLFLEIIFVIAIFF
ncbi:hypothetical protein JOD45_000382 [Scopulibacillus daqui]|uniref:Uncharacterized protein n=1 Tax=Scopulibacillus daqui TaxID=1469162 RepID=A0ABS2PVW7_9BACL|nr:hypothetical protein [Scopulibacillus daqui]